MLMAKSRLCWRLLRLGVHLIYGCVQIALFFERSNTEQKLARIQTWSQQLLRICGVRLSVHGQIQDVPVQQSGQLIVANHISWLDIYAINAIQPVRFVSKDDVVNWPILGWLITRADTIFLNRGCRRSAHQASALISNALTQGISVAIFPEGTTTKGESVLPFKSGLLQSAVIAKVPVKPIAIRYLDEHGNSNVAPAYYDDISLWQSLSATLQLPSTLIDVYLFESIATENFSRQQMAQAAHKHIAQCLSSCQTQVAQQEQLQCLSNQA